jgi:hypothetical protein
MDRVLAIFNLVFGCHHRHLSRVFTMGGRTYRVCCDCGMNFKYSLSTMSMESRLGLPNRQNHKGSAGLSVYGYPNSGTKKLQGLGISYGR